MWLVSMLPCYSSDPRMAGGSVASKTGAPASQCIKIGCLAQGRWVLGKHQHSRTEAPWRLQGGDNQVKGVEFCTRSSQSLMLRASQDFWKCTCSLFTLLLRRCALCPRLSLLHKNLFLHWVTKLHGASLTSPAVAINFYLSPQSCKGGLAYFLS